MSCRYKVFLSFRGEDTRDTFVAHLYKELDRKGIHTFKDDPKLKRGESVEPVIFDAIQDSRCSLVVLSEDYASSTWCLKELVKIMECKDKDGLKQIVIPVFYKVDPSHVSDHKGKFKEALYKHEADFAEKFSENEEKYQEAMQKLQRWKEALTQVAYLGGWDSRRNHRDEATFVEQIVSDISDRLTCESSTDTNDLVGMRSHVMEMEKLLHIEKQVVRMVGIWGANGIGKTKIARVIYSKHFNQFDGYCFLDEVRVKFKNHGASSLKKELLSKTLQEKIPDTWPLDRDSNIIKEKLGRKKVLIVVDDVDNQDQLEVLINRDWFGPGSRIIVTARDKQLLTAHKVKDVYEVPRLQDDQALQLFCRYAFKQNQPKEGYSELSDDFVSYTDGLPLALKVLGTFLCEKSPQEWQSELNKLRKHPNKTIQELLEISYHGLDDTQQKAFLDIACFFNGEDEHFVRRIIDGCGFFADSTLRVLKDKAMITISDSKVFVYVLLQEMARGVVRKESEEYFKWSRLWDHDHIRSVLTKPKETGKFEGIFLDAAKIDKIEIHPEAFKGQDKLRLLKFCIVQSLAQKRSNVQLKTESLSSISEVLRFLHWPTCPLVSLPSEFCPKYLVELNLPYSNIQQLWLGKQPLVNLVSVDLNHSNLITIPDLSEAQKLQRLNLQGCSDLDDASTIEHVTELQYLNLRDCKNLKHLPSMINLRFLKTLDLSNCSSLEKICQLPGNIEYLYLARTAIQELPLPTGCRWRLVKLDLRNCSMLMKLPREIFTLNCLKKLNIAGCPCLFRRVTGAGMEIPNEEEKEDTEEEVNKMEAAIFENQESAADLSDKNAESLADTSSEPINERSGCLVATAASSLVDVCATTVSADLVRSSGTLNESIHVCRADICRLAVAENTKHNGDPELHRATTGDHQARFVHALESVSIMSTSTRTKSKRASSKKIAPNKKRRLQGSKKAPPRDEGDTPLIAAKKKRAKFSIMMPTEAHLSKPIHCELDEDANAFDSSNTQDVHPGVTSVGVVNPMESVPHKTATSSLPLVSSKVNTSTSIEGLSITQVQVERVLQSTQHLELVVASDPKGKAPREIDSPTSSFEDPFVELKNLFMEEQCPSKSLKIIPEEEPTKKTLVSLRHLFENSLEDLLSNSELVLQFEKVTDCLALNYNLPTSIVQLVEKIKNVFPTIKSQFLLDTKHIEQHRAYLEEKNTIAHEAKCCKEKRDSLIAMISEKDKECRRLNEEIAEKEGKVAKLQEEIQALRECHEEMSSPLVQYKQRKKELLEEARKWLSTGRSIMSAIAGTKASFEVAESNCKDAIQQWAEFKRILMENNPS